MKKGISILVLVSMVAVGAAFADGLSFGGGALFDLSLGNGYDGSAGGVTVKSSLDNTSFGAFVFFDAKYVEANLIFAFGSLKPHYEMSGGGYSVSSDGDALDAMQLGISVLGKYPFEVGSITLFPLLGISYNMVLSVKDSDGNKADDPGDLSQLGILAGLGLDVNITDALFFRAEGLFQVRLPSKGVSDNVPDGVDTTLGFGPVIKVAIGYRF
jgi:hypothetical protein